MTKLVRSADMSDQENYIKNEYERLVGIWWLLSLKYEMEDIGEVIELARQREA